VRIQLDFGQQGLAVEVPDEHLAGILTLREASAAEDGPGAVREALADPIGKPPLAKIATGKRTACIVVCDITRPVPNPVILPEVLAILDAAGIPRSAVTILNATGTHRPNSDEELRQMLGDEAFETCVLVNHDCTRDADMIDLGVSPNGVPILLNRHYVNADLKITLGMIEPHFMAGYAGGRKMVMPGVAGLKSVQAWHSPRFLEHPLATNGSVVGNPVHDEALWITQQCPPDFIIDVALDKHKQIAKVFAGDLVKAWFTGVDFVAENNTADMEEPVDVVITTTGGYPLDLTFYQTVKGMVGALPALKPGGTVIIASACSEGIGNHHFRDTIFGCPDIHQFLAQIEDPGWNVVADQWQVEELAKAVRHHRVSLKCDGIPAETVQKLFVKPIESIEDEISACIRLYGPETKIVVIPKGPYVIPRVRSNA